MSELYTGLRPPKNFKGIHIPFIEVREISGAATKCYEMMEDATHLIITSQTTLEILKTTPKVPHFCVGKKTASKVSANTPLYIAENETAEGVVELLKKIPLPKESYILWPRASRARAVIEKYLQKTSYHYQIVDLYETVAIKPKIIPEACTITKVHFTSPSTVHAFFSVYGAVENLEFETIGPVTQSALDSYLVNRPQ